MSEVMPKPAAVGTTMPKRLAATTAQTIDYRIEDTTQVCKVERLGQPDDELIKIVPVKFEIIGDTSHLFSAEDFSKKDNVFPK